MSDEKKETPPPPPPKEEAVKLEAHDVVAYSKLYPDRYHALDENGELVRVDIEDDEETEG